MNETRLTPTDRLGIALFLAGLFHLVLILGLRFTMPHAASGHALDVTLVQTASQTPPKQTARLAQFNAEGGGGAHKKHMAHAPFAAASAGGGSQYQKARPLNKPAHHQLRLLRARNAPLHIMLTKPAWSVHAAIAQEIGVSKRFAAEEARLKAEIRRDMRAYRVAGRGRGGVTARRFAYARYIARWNQHMERLGSRQYQRALAGRNLTGSLILDVRIRPNGSLASVKVIQGSGSPALNAAAVAVVKNAAPFAPLPKAGEARLGVLPIIETWRFRGGHMTGSAPSVSTTP